MNLLKIFTLVPVILGIHLSSTLPLNGGPDTVPSMSDNPAPKTQIITKKMAAKKQPAEIAHAPGTIVTLPSDQLKKHFLKESRLTKSDLRPTATPGTYVAEIDAKKLTQEQRKRYKASVNQRYQALLTPTDPIYPQWYTDKIAAPSAWDISTGTSSIIVAVLDTGFGLQHEDMLGRWHENTGEKGPTVVEGPAPNCTSRNITPLDMSCNNIDDDLDGFTDNWQGWDFAQGDNDPSAGSIDALGDFVSHGTIVSGLVGATGNNAVGVASINWGATILPIQVLTDDGEGYSDTVADGIRYAADRGADVISMSLGAPDPDGYLKNAIDYATSKGVILVAAAGNDGCDCIIYPANYPDVVAVGASTVEDKRASFSSYGSNLDIMAPGAGTIKAPYWQNSNRTTSYTSTANGTSIATPIISGAVALVKSKHSSATSKQIVQILTDSTDRLPEMNSLYHTKQYGFGRINAAKLLNTPPTLHSAPPAEAVPVYRFWSDTYKSHFYTSDQAEKEYVEQAYPQNVWRYENITYHVTKYESSCPVGTSPVYRFWSDTYLSHFYTSDEAEKNHVLSSLPVWNKFEGARFCASQELSTTTPPVYRFWNPRLKRHFYTGSYEERDLVITTMGAEWSEFEGRKFYAF